MQVNRYLCGNIFINTFRNGLNESWWRYVGWCQKQEITCKGKNTTKMPVYTLSLFSISHWFGQHGQYNTTTHAALQDHL